MSTGEIFTAKGVIEVSSWVRKFPPPPEKDKSISN
jgi:hypothetical protein